MNEGTMQKAQRWARRLARTLWIRTGGTPWLEITDEPPQAGYRYWEEVRPDGTYRRVPPPRRIDGGRLHPR